MDSDKISKLFSVFYETSKTCAEEVIKRLKDDDQKTLLEDLEQTVRKVATIENNTRNEARALDLIENNINRSEDSEWGDLSKMLEETMAKSKSSVSYTQGLQDYEKHVKNVFDSLELEDMIVASSETNIDPYSKKPIVHPIKSKVCNHVFDKKTVMEILSTKGRNGTLRCPYMGCNHKFTANDLVDIKTDNDSDGE